MNVYDSDRMQDLMLATGYETTEDPSEADMVIIKTCHIREKASEKLFSDLGRLRPFKEKRQSEGKEMIVAVAGCVAQAEGEEIFRRSQIADIVVGPESYQTLPDLVGKVIREKSKQINLSFSPIEKFDVITGSPYLGGTSGRDSDAMGVSKNLPYLGGFERKENDLNDRFQREGRRDSDAMGVSKKISASAFVTVQEGCDKFCTFCVVPYTRGAEYSRDEQKIYDDALRLTDQGVKEIYFLGQNVNAYHGNDSAGNPSSLAKLIEKIAQIPQVERIRYTTSHPRDMSDDLIAAHRDIEKLMPFLHLPIQSGANSVLKAMNRKHTRQDYFKIIEKLRKARPDMGLSSDFIVGFPGETDKDFEDTMDLVRQINFTQCYSFKYSPRPGTPAADAKIQVPEEIKDERLAQLQKLLSEQQIAFNQKFEGETMPVLFEKEAKKLKENKLPEPEKFEEMARRTSSEEGVYKDIHDQRASQVQRSQNSNSDGYRLWGKSPWLQSVIVEVANEEEKQKYLGKIAQVKILKSRPSSLIGQLIGN